MPIITTYKTASQIVGLTLAISTDDIELTPSGIQITAAKTKSHIVDRKAPFRVITPLDIATKMPYDSEFATTSISPTVVCDENDEFRGSIRQITPVAARIMPKIFTHLSLSVPIIAPVVRANIGIVTANKEAFEAFVSDSPVVNKS